MNITQQTVLHITWDEAQRIADHHRRRGIKVHVCQLSINVHVLWPAR